MWILPRTYSLFAPDMAASSSDYDAMASVIPSSLMWRSKPSPWRIWLRRWKRVSWLRALFGRMLKPSRRKCFEGVLTSSLAAIRASRSARQESAAAPTTPDTCGQPSEEQLTLFGPESASSRTLKATLPLGSVTCCKTWDGWVTERRGAYSARKKSALRTGGSESSSWRSPTVNDPRTPMDKVCVNPGGSWYDKETGRNAQYGLPQQVQVTWATPSAQNNHEGWYQTSGGKIYPGLAMQAVNWPSPHANASTGAGSQGRSGGLNLQTAVGPPALANPNTSGKNPARLNPAWVEQLMGLPAGWTDFGCWGTE